MATGTFTWGQFKYSSSTSWHSYQNLGTSHGYTSNNYQYSYIGKLKTPTFDGTPSAVSLRFSYIRMQGDECTSGKFTLYVYKTDIASSITSSTAVPSGYISSGSATWSANDRELHPLNVTMNNPSSFESNTTYYVLIRNVETDSSNSSFISVGYTDKTSTTYWTGTLTYTEGGFIYIDNGTSFDKYEVYIDNGTSWDRYVPYIDNGSDWDECG